MTTIQMKHLKKDWPDKVSKVLFPYHLEDLRKSGLEDENILEARIHSVTSQESKTYLNRSSEVGPGFVIPYPARIGFSCGINFKPDIPIRDAEGKLRKYIRPTHSKQQFYIPRQVWMVLKQRAVPLVFTEGEKKALKATQEGFYTIALSGVWGWMSNHRPIDDFGLMNFRGRVVYIIFDADKHTNPNVLKAEQCLAQHLTDLGASVQISDLSEGAS